jgi:hypothetical protein
MYRVTKRDAVDIKAHNHYLAVVYLTTLAAPQLSDDMMVTNNELKIIRTEAIVA